MRWLPPILLVLLGAAFGVCADTPRLRPEALVIYVDDESPGSHQVLEKLRAALASSRTATRPSRLELAAADVSDKQALEAVLRRVLDRRPALIIASNSNVAAVAKSLTRDVPVVFASHQDPIGMGLAQSLARPGGNLTGYTYFVPVDEKRLELLNHLSPHSRKLGILVDRWWLDESGGRAAVKAARERLGFEVELFHAETELELGRALRTPRAKSIEVWYVPYTRLAYERPDAIVGGLDKLRRPVIYPTTRFVEEGGLISYQPVLPMDEAIGLLATAVGLVLAGVPAGEIPIERPKAFELSINVDTARALRIAVPDELLKRANRVIVKKAVTWPAT
ncbi:MAG: ABC transporter substrate-binding protein [Burkholderiales bacterium]|nr:ABC transporter substrate-binding protein [Burkholderiales bacterium]